MGNFLQVVESCKSLLDSIPYSLSCHSLICILWYVLFFRSLVWPQILRSSTFHELLSKSNSFEVYCLYNVRLVHELFLPFVTWQSLVSLIFCDKHFGNCISVLYRGSDFWDRNMATQTPSYFQFLFIIYVVLHAITMFCATRSI